jgi:hypothetical protein
MTLEELQDLYAEKGATTTREEETEQGTKQYTDAVQYGDGWTAFENDNRKIIDYIGQGMDATPVYDDAPKTLGGFSKQEGDYITDYDLTGKAIARREIETNDLKQIWNDLGPIAMAFLTGPGGGGEWLGKALGMGLTGTAAAGAGGALAGGFNAAMTDQDILKGALKGGVSSAGAMKLGDTGFTLGDVNKAINFAQNPTLAGAANIASPYVTTNFDIGDTGFTTNDLLKGVNTVQALGSGDDKRIFDTITGLFKGTDFSGLTATEKAELDANRETKRLNRIENAVLNQPASDDGSTQGILDLINEMYPSAGIKGMSEGQLANFLEANMDEIKGSADLETLLKGEGKKTEDEGTVTVTGDRPINLDDFISLNNVAGNTSNNYADDTVFVTGDKEGDYVPSLRTKEIKSDIPDELTVDDIDKLKLDTKIDDILQTITVPGGTTKTTVPATVTPKVTVPGTKTTEQALIDLGLNAPMPSQDPYANIKLMEELFGGDMAYKLRALGAPKNQASTDMDALARLLRNKNA